jgi:hypothetical protein
MSTKTYAGIGSRETPTHILALMTKTADQLAKDGWLLRSGHAPGADMAFETGCDNAQGKKEIYLPWQGFEHSKSPYFLPDGNKLGKIEGYVAKKAYTLAKQHHPDWSKMTTRWIKERKYRWQEYSPAQKLLARNGLQILGQTLQTPVTCVLSYTTNGEGEGGTGQGLRIAKSLNIPIFDFGTYDRAPKDLLPALETFLAQFK